MPADSTPESIRSQEAKYAKVPQVHVKYGRNNFPLDREANRGILFSMPSPIERMIDQAVRCACCGIQGVGNCDCWKAEGSPCRKCSKCPQHCKCKRKRRKEKTKV